MSDTPMTDARVFDADLVSASFARELERENIGMKTALAACIAEMKYSARMGQPISEDRREFLMAAPFLPNAQAQR
jgi:hypothetical protein